MNDEWLILGKGFEKFPTNMEICNRSVSYLLRKGDKAAALQMLSKIVLQFVEVIHLVVTTDCCVGIRWISPSSF